MFMPRVPAVALPGSGLVLLCTAKGTGADHPSTPTPTSSGATCADCASVVVSVDGGVWAVVVVSAAVVVLLSVAVAVVSAAIVVVVSGVVVVVSPVVVALVSGVVVV